MVALQTPKTNKGWKAVDFNLPGVDGNNYSLKQIAGKNGLVVMFICNHCPFVKAIVDKLVIDANTLQKTGIGVVAINANDARNYPDDSYENMISFAKTHKFSFPYLHDETQSIAKKYDAVCTPDFFGFDKNLELQYRGRFDESGMKQLATSKHELLEAMQEIAQKGKFSGQANPSIGCSIKWRD